MQAVRAPQKLDPLYDPADDHAEDEQTEGLHGDGQRREVADAPLAAMLRVYPYKRQSQWAQARLSPRRARRRSWTLRRISGRGHLDYTEGDRTERVREATDGDGADDILEMVGGDFPQKPPVS